MQEPDDKKLDSTEWDLVVIGRGYSALVNCLTRLSCTNLPEKTLLIGKKDPWQSYVNHRMGQHAPFLALPGYQRDFQHRGEQFEDYLQSQKFGESNQRQLEFLLTKGISIATGVIEDPLSHENDRWVIPFQRNPNKVFIKSKHVDICSGPGPARRFNPDDPRLGGPWVKNIGRSFDATVRSQLYDDSGNDALIAERFMQTKCVRKKVVVVGEGPLSASAVEHAIENGAEKVVWVGRPLEMSRFSFPASTRYDHLITNGMSIRDGYLAITPKGDNIEQEYLNNATHFNNAMTPRDKKVVIALGLVDSVSRTTLSLVGTGRIGLTLLENNSTKTGSGSEEVEYEQLVISASSENSIRDVRSVAFMLQSIPRIVAPDTPFQSLERFGMFVGLEVPNKSLRVLGAASRNLELMQQALAFDTPADISYKQWVSSLSPQVKMPNNAMGITIGAASVAHANNFYSETNPDKCLQTTVLGDINLRNQRGSSIQALRAEQVATEYDNYPRHF